VFVFIEASERGFSLVGLEPTIQWRFGQTNVVGAAGVLFTLAGQNAMESIYPTCPSFVIGAEVGRFS
jgi:hypothetical protein